MPDKTPKNSFKDFSNIVVQNFLQSVMVVDDQAYFPDSSQIAEKKAGGLISPGLRSSGTVAAEKELQAKAVKEKPDGKNLTANERLNAKKLIDGFAKTGISCTVLVPKDSSEKQLESKVLNLSKKSDMIVFDWVLGKDILGTTISNLVKKIIKISIKEDRKLRLIAVYTGNNDLRKVITTLDTKLKRAAKFKKEGDFTLVSDTFRIIVLAKKPQGILDKTIPRDKEIRKREIVEDKLPRKLIEEFTEMTSGLVSNVALQAFAVIRDNTYRILSKFHSGLDAPFAAHRFMLPHPSDANEFLTTLIGSEITAVLEGKRVGDFADSVQMSDRQYNFLRKWTDNLVEKNSEIPQKWKRLNENIAIDSSNAKNRIYEFLTEDGAAEKRVKKTLTTSEEEKNSFAEEMGKSMHTQNLTSNFLMDGREAKHLDMEFAYLTSIASFYKDKPVLRFGTVLKLTETENPRYYLCIQPLCDCVRISGKRKFPFLELKVISDDKKRFDLVISEGNGNYIKVSINYRPYDSSSIEFGSTKPSRTVESKIVGDKKFIFTTTENPPHKYLWLGELKFAHIQRVANEYATKFSRVGLDESEWLRRWSLKSEN
jgi:hypothetical protein